MTDAFQILLFCLSATLRDARWRERATTGPIPRPRRARASRSVDGTGNWKRHRHVGVLESASHKSAGRARGVDERFAMDNKARALKSMFRQRAEQRGLPSGSSARPAKVARREAPPATGGESGARPSTASRGGGAPPPGFFESDVPRRSGDGASASRAASAAPAAAPAATAAGVPSGFFDAPETRARAAPEARDASATVVGDDSDGDAETGDDKRRSEERRGTPSRRTGSSNAPKTTLRGVSVPDAFFDSSVAAERVGKRDGNGAAEDDDILSSFEKEIQADIESAAMREQEDAALEAIERGRREAEEHAERVASVERLKRKAEEARNAAREKRKANGSKDSNRNHEEGAAFVQKKEDAKDAGAEDEDDDAVSEDALLVDALVDWRAKRVCFRESVRRRGD